MIGHFTHLACLFEATARKVGNVHRYRDFEDLTYLEFVLSAAAIAPVMELAPSRSVGATVLCAVEATRAVVKTNTNLGIALLLAPLAATDNRVQLAERLAALTVEDSVLVYRAIRLAQPGGLGEVREQDVASEPTLPLRELMALAQERDSIAAEYVNGFESIFDLGVPALLDGYATMGSLEAAILHCQLNFLTEKGDSLLRRKRGDAENERLRNTAARVLALGMGTASGMRELTQLDGWLREEGHSRNPGTTADLVTACLFVALRERRLTGSEPFPWTAWAGS
jgi:triphosphoribosyl-dephospho-CoA synthase